MCGHAVLLFALVQALGASPADTLAKARAQAKSLEFGAALATAHEALELGGADPALTAQIHAFSGEMAAALGDRELARSEFARALELNPAFSLDASASPRIREPFDDAHTRAGQRALALEVSSAAEGTGSVTTRVSTVGDVFALVAGFELELEADGRFEAKPWPSSSTRLEWFCPKGPCRYVVVALDKFGNQLTTAGTLAAPLTVWPAQQLHAGPPPNEPLVEPASPRTPWYTHAGPYLAAGAVILAAVAVFFGLQFDSEQRQLLSIEANRSSHLMSEATNLDSSRQRDHTLLFVSAIAAGLAAGGAIFTW